MKTPVKSLALAAALSLLSAASWAGSCPTTAAAPAPRADNLRETFTQIESALQAGRITPYEAGRMLRQNYEVTQFQRGFLEATPARQDCAAGIDLAPLSDMAGSMAKNGVETAGKVMRALMREGERLIREKSDGSEI